jgi:hypothetical protein
MSNQSDQQWRCSACARRTWTASGAPPVPCRLFIALKQCEPGEIEPPLSNISVKLCRLARRADDVFGRVVERLQSERPPDDASHQGSDELQRPIAGFSVLQTEDEEFRQIVTECALIIDPYWVVDEKPNWTNPERIPAEERLICHLFGDDSPRSVWVHLHEIWEELGGTHDPFWQGKGFEPRLRSVREERKEEQKRDDEWRTRRDSKRKGADSEGSENVDPTSEALQGDYRKLIARLESQGFDSAKEEYTFDQFVADQRRDRKLEQLRSRIFDRGREVDELHRQAGSDHRSVIGALCVGADWLTAHVPDSVNRGHDPSYRSQKQWEPLVS